jgi:hypothetical protein
MSYWAYCVRCGQGRQVNVKHRCDECADPLYQIGDEVYTYDERRPVGFGKVIEVSAKDGAFVKVEKKYRGRTWVIGFTRNVSLKKGNFLKAKA